MKCGKHIRYVISLPMISLLLITALSWLISACHRQQTDGLVFDDSDFASPEEGGKAKGKEADKGQKKSGKVGELMYGRIVDRNDLPMKRVTIEVSPGNGELISNKWGEYEIDTLHSDDGSPLSLKKGQEYKISAWKAGYHEAQQIFRYEGGTQEIPTITLIEDTIKIEPMEPVNLAQPQVDDSGQTGVGQSGGGE